MSETERKSSSFMIRNMTEALNLANVYELPEITSKPMVSTVSKMSAPVCQKWLMVRKSSNSTCTRAKSSLSSPYRLISAIAPLLKLSP
eukprot:2341614-Karenia_brevis.AAC.1